MRRFAVIVFILSLSALAYVAFERPAKTADISAGAASASGDAREMAAVAAKRAEWDARLEAEFRALEDEPADGSGKTVTQIAERDKAIAATVHADAEEFAPAHIPTSASAVEIDPAVGKLSLMDLTSTTQRELVRLGCYGAKVDGLWGPKSRAAVRTFNERISGNWTERPTAELVTALRAAPQGLCEQSCSGGAQGKACAIASNAGARKGQATDEAADYLPPWMQGQRLASTDADADLSLAAETPQIAESKLRSRKSAARRVVRERYAEERPTRRRHDWTPSNWPGTAH